MPMVATAAVAVARPPALRKARRLTTAGALQSAGFGADPDRTVAQSSASCLFPPVRPYSKLARSSWTALSLAASEAARGASMLKYSNRSKASFGTARLSIKMRFPRALKRYRESPRSNGSSIECRRSLPPPRSGSSWCRAGSPMRPLPRSRSLPGFQVRQAARGRTPGQSKTGRDERTVRRISAATRRHARSWSAGCPSSRR